MEAMFQQQMQRYQSDLQRQTTRFDLLGYLKLGFFVVLCISLYLTFTKDALFFGGFSGVLLIFNGLLWFLQFKVRSQMDYAKGMMAIHQQYLDRISGAWVNFPDMGEDFIDPEHPYSADLDIVGKKSLFQLLNVTHTWHGRQAFAQDLLNPSYDIQELERRQEGIRELSKEIEFSTKIQYPLSKIGSNASILKLLEELKDNRQLIPSKGLRVFLRMLPRITMIIFLSALLLKWKWLYGTACLLLFLQAICWILGILQTNKYLSPITNLPYRLASYSNVLHQLQAKTFSSQKLVEIQSKLAHGDSSAAQAIKSLGKITDRINVRSQGLVWLLLNILFLWDYQCALSLMAWKERYAQVSESWFLALGEFESLLSLSTLASSCSQVTFPQFTDDKHQFQGKALGHPLIANDTRVSNDFALEDQIAIISGSNMSGKTTFLRTVGINLILAKAGGLVCAESLTCSPFHPITSMRIADDLKEGISTFYGELKRIKAIIEMAKEEPGTLFLIDEIFRGTNSVDRLYGAKTVISELNRLGVCGFITTHDMELCQLSKEQKRIVNYSFSEDYQDNRIIFDYQIKKGPSTTTNAKALMKMVGILSE